MAALLRRSANAGGNRELSAIPLVWISGIGLSAPRAKLEERL